MAVQPQTPYKEYTANGSTKSFALEFDCDNQDHLIVLVDDMEPVVGTWSLSGGVVVFGTAPNSGKKITIQRNTPASRSTEYKSSDNSFRPGPINKDFDRIWLRLQELGVADWILSNRIEVLKKYTDQQDTKLQKNIDNLKTYVDDRDDELRAYLLEEIRKQGVALDQLEDYYNYLMQRLAQIAVDKGWEASFVVDASGKNQQEVNDGLESIAELRNTNPPRKGLRVYVKSYHADLRIGGGEFVSTQKASLADNGVTVFSSLNPLFVWVRINYSSLTLPMAGAKGDDVYDDAPATIAAIATNLPVVAPKPKVRYCFESPIVLTAGQSLIGEGERIKVRCAHTGACFQMMGNATLKNFEPYPTSDLERYKYIGVLLGNDVLGDRRSVLNNEVDNVKPFFPKVGFKLTNAAYWNTFKNIDIFKFRDYGIILTEQSNNNFFQFRTLTSNAEPTTTSSGYEYKYTEITWEQAAIRVSGNQNVFIGGENAPSKWGVIIDPNSSGNRFIGMYGEHQLYPLKTAAGTENFYDSTASMGTMQIHPDSIVHGQSGKQYTRYASIEKVEFAGNKGLTAAWYFNESKGNKIYDYSGNGNTLTVSNPIWSKTEGRWGNTLVLDAARTTSISPIPLTSVDWENPFTFAACVKIPEGSGDNFVLSLRDSNGRYIAVTVYPSNWSIVDYDGVSSQVTSAGKMKRSTIDGYSWVTIYFDPINKTVSSISTEIGQLDNIVTPKPPRFSPFISGGGGGISVPVLGARHSTGLNGSFAFVGFWQRKLTLPEVSELVNGGLPQLFPVSAPVRMENQSNNTINLQPTATNSEIISALNQLATENNDLKDKMRSAGLMLS